jgi:hypothetical protein
VHHEQELQDSCNAVFATDIVYFRNASVNKLHTGDDDDDDDDRNRDSVVSVVTRLCARRYNARILAG